MKNVFIGLKFFILTTLLLGLLYPLLITLVGQTVFNTNSNGDPYLIGQKFDQDKYFWPRPSAVDYNPLPSGGSNLSATSRTLNTTVEAKKTNSLQDDLLTASGSGLDPHITPAAALSQVDRVMKARQLDMAKKDAIITLIARLTEGRDLGFLGEPRVNVLRLNTELDKAL